MEKIKEIFNTLKKEIIENKLYKLIFIIIVVLIAALIALKLATKIYIKVNGKEITCTYESTKSSYSTLTIKETITNTFIKNKRTKITTKTTYTILNKDKDKLSSMKNEKKMYAQTFKDIKGAKAKYSSNGYKVSTTVTYNLNKMEKDKIADLNINKDEKYDDIKAYYEGYGYKCK